MGVAQEPAVVVEEMEESIDNSVEDEPIVAMPTENEKPYEEEVTEADEVAETGSNDK